MRLRLRLFGYTVLSLTYDMGQPEVEEAPEGMTGGTTLYTERDMDPINPSNEEPWYDRGFGFR